MVKRFFFIVFISSVCSCSNIEPVPFQPSKGHINIGSRTTPSNTNIPTLVKELAPLPKPAHKEKELERYTVNVHQRPVKELLFALARDAEINIDIHPNVDGLVTINAIEQTLPQILERISKQTNIRYEYDNKNLFITNDIPFLRIYNIDYINTSRDITSSNTVATQISSGTDNSSSGSGGNNSTTSIVSSSTNHFWGNLVANLNAIIDDDASLKTSSSSIIANPESGIISVKATLRQHKEIQKFIDHVMASAKRQVMVQITIVEVTLRKQYQAGIDWSFLNQAGKSGIDIVSSTLTGAPVTNALSSFVIRAVDPLSDSQNNPDNINTNTPSRKQSLTATISLLDEFGDINILSSPQLMVLNNQTALLKVVENIVYFKVDSELSPASTVGGLPVRSIDTTAQTISVGIVMAVTPQIDSSGTVTLNIRPTISRLNGRVIDPNPNAQFQDNQGNQVVNEVPQVAVREMESVLQMKNGQIGVLGGLMQDENQNNDAGLPGNKKIGILGNLFKSKSSQHTKTELVIFIRPIVINNPSIDKDLQEYKEYLPNISSINKKHEGLGEKAL